MKHILLLLALPLLLSACAVRGTGLPPLGQPRVEPVVEADACGAARFAYLVGQPKSLADRTAFPPRTRVILPGTAVTMDHREDRLNVLIDGNAAVERVYCG
jgi:hypothetical protein